MLPLVEPLERVLMESLISELNCKFNTGLDSNFSTSRDHLETIEDEQPPAAKENIIAVGSSHLSRTVLSMRNFGNTIKSLANPSWRLTEENVQATAASLAEAVKNNPEATVVYQLFNSSVYFASSAPGELALPKRGEDGVYHVVGELSLADWSAFRKIFYVSIPLLRARGGKQETHPLSTPTVQHLQMLPRYRSYHQLQQERLWQQHGVKAS